MPYVDYGYYVSFFFGTLIPEKEFCKKALEASSKVKYNTFGRIDENEIPSEVKNATCSIAELLYDQERLKNSITNQNADNKQIASETLGPRSITYLNNNSEISKQILNDSDLNKKIRNICHEFLDDTGLMFRGIYE